MKTSKITVHTKLDSGIYQSSGGGEDRTVATYNIGPRNLLSAIAYRQEERTSNIRIHGGIGCGSTWLEISGVIIDDSDLDDVSQNDRELYDNDYDLLHCKSRTQKAADLINDVLSGALKRRYDDEMECN